MEVSNEEVVMVCSEQAARQFLSHRRLAVIGASANPKKFGHTVYAALRDAGYEVVPVNPSAPDIDGAPCYPRLADVPDPVDGAVVMVPGLAAVAAVNDCAEAGLSRVWLFQGLGGTGSASVMAVDACQAAGMEVVAGACPLMFLEPVGWFHKVHRACRHARGSLNAA